MRILVVASWYPTQTNMVRGSFIREQALALARQGNDVDVFYFDSSPRSVPLTIRSERRDGLVEHGIALPYPLHRLLGFYLPSVLARSLRRLVLNGGYDIVHAHAARPAAVVSEMALRGLAVPLVITEHRGNLSGFWLTEHGRKQVKTAYTRCAQLVAVSKSLRASIEGCFPDLSGHCGVFYNGVDTERFDTISGIEAEDRRGAILFLGGVAENKGLSLLLDALAQLPRDIQLTVAGPGATQEAVMPLAERRSVSGRVRAIGLVSRQQVVELMNRHAVLAVPSRYETFSLVAAEALACGTPVVATRCGGPEEILREPFGKLVPLGDSRAFADAVAIFTKREAAPCLMARQWVLENFSILRLVSDLQNLYSEVLRDPKYAALA